MFNSYLSTWVVSIYTGCCSARFCYCWQVELAWLYKAGIWQYNESSLGHL